MLSPIPQKPELSDQDKELGITWKCLSFHLSVSTCGVVCIGILYGAIFWAAV